METPLRRSTSRPSNSAGEADQLDSMCTRRHLLRDPACIDQMNSRPFPKPDRSQSVSEDAKGQSEYRQTVMSSEENHLLD
jgi:hypothetical protein